MTSLLLHLHNSLKVTPLEDNQVQVTVTLQSDEYIHYIRLLDSLTGLFRTINTKNRLAKANAYYESEKHAEETGKIKAKYYSRLVESFDLYTSQGLDRKTAIKKISTDLRKENHPWSSPDLVKPSLVAAGRDEVHFFPVSFRVKRYNSDKQDNIAPDRTSTTISGFSSKSLSQLHFTAISSP